MVRCEPAWSDLFARRPHQHRIPQHRSQAGREGVEVAFLLLVCLCRFLHLGLMWRMSKRRTRSRISFVTPHALTVSKSNSRFAQIIWRHLDIDLISHADADEIFAHLTRNVRQHFVAVG